MENTNKNRHLKLSRRDKMRKSPITWIILLVISISVGIIKNFPEYTNWKKFRNNIAIMEINKTKLKEDYELNQSTLKELKNNFREKSEFSLSEEKQVFPEKIDVHKIVRILEMFSIKLKDLRALLLQESYFDLNSINLSQTRQEKEYSTTALSISFSADEKNLRRFIKFLQTGKISEEIKKTFSNDAIEGNFLEKNLLPLLNINAIGISEEKKKGKQNTNRYYTVKLQATLFSR